MIEKLIQGLGEVLKGLIEITIKNIKIDMFNRYNYTINNYFDNDVDRKTVEKLNQAQMSMLMGLDVETYKSPVVETQDTEPQSEDCKKNPNP